MTLKEKNRIEDEYFEWLYRSAGGYNTGGFTFRKLLIDLHSTDFRYLIPKDKNRAIDGMDLRRHYGLMITDNDEDETDYIVDILDRPCSVLEMMVALSMRCEKTIMDNPAYGDRTGQWFWGMITNMGLGTMYDTNYDKQYVMKIVNRFLDRKYSSNGKGGLFTIKDCDVDLREVEIWYQLNWYLNNFS